MLIKVEPLDGSELDRLITALVNATGVVSRMVDEADATTAGDGEAVIGAVAERAHRALAPHVEFLEDDDLAAATGALALVTLVLSEEMGLEELYYVPREDE